MKIFYAAIAIIAALLIYQIVGTTWRNAQLDNTKPEYTIGSQEADLTIVEFLNYNCQYCREIHPTIMQAIETDGNARYIPRPIGMTGDAEALMKAALSYSAGNQGKIKEIQKDLFNHFRPIDEEFVAELITKHNFDQEQFNNDFGDQKTKDLIEKNHKLFLAVGTNATPTFIIGGKILYVPTGKMPTVQDFLDMFAQARDK